MRKLAIPQELRGEFATVEACWQCGGKTLRVDSLILAWVKFEKQLRRLFCFLIYQHPQINEPEIKKVVSLLADNSKLYPETFIQGIDALGVKSVPDLLGGRHKELWADICRIKKYRNKLIHGQVTGQDIQIPQLEKDVIRIIEWVSCLSQAAEKEFGYDGIKRNTFRSAKSASSIVVGNYPFNNVKEFNKWLENLTSNKAKKITQVTS